MGGGHVAKNSARHFQAVLLKYARGEASKAELEAATPARSAISEAARRITERAKRQGEFKVASAR
jgi:hypothetical protein